MISMKSAMPKSHRRNQAGFGLLMAIFLVATMILIASAMAPGILTEGQRQKEEEMKWRGEQYQRAIGMYYIKFRKYPTKIEDLTSLTNGMRFLRQAYTDPMSTREDHKWRLIHAAPNGQLLDSLRQTSLLQNSLGVSNLLGAGNPFGAGLQPLSQPGQLTTGAQGGPGASGQQTNSAASPNSLESQPQPLGGDIIGGNIVGVGGSNKKPSFRVYLGGDTYEKWEFIANPTLQGAVPGQTPVNPNANPTSIPGGPGANPAGGLPPQQNPPPVNPLPPNFPQ